MRPGIRNSTMRSAPTEGVAGKGSLSELALAYASDDRTMRTTVETYLLDKWGITVGSE
jgi:hypothetical protein